MSNEDEQTIAATESNIERCYLTLRNINEQIDKWDQRIKLATSKGAIDLAREARLRQEILMEERDKIETLIRKGNALLKILKSEREKYNGKSFAERFTVDQQSGESSLAVNRPVEEILHDINALVGLSNIKQEVSTLVNALKVQKLRRSAGLPVPDVSNHMVFYGNPGTGKTTIARKIAEIYRSLGLLSKGHLIESDRSSLVAGYLGQTAIKTKNILEEARGGILFIDEAYTLCQCGEQDQYGQEAIDTILKHMEDNRGDLVVIVAGYEAKMASFIESNPGLKSRFSKYFNFPDYSPSELALIFIEMAVASKYRPTCAFVEVLESMCQLMYTHKSSNFGNGRAIRNLFEKCISNQANRIVAIPSPTPEQLSELVESDISIDDIDFAMR